jgi:hypothetical protein
VVVAPALIIVPMLSGCVSESNSTSTRHRGAGATPAEMPSSRDRTADNRAIDPIDNPEGSSVSLLARSALMPLGSVPYDGFSLPLISPDARFVATQTGAPPDWAVTLAERDARPPTESPIAIYRVDAREVSPEQRQQPQLVATLEAPAVLGRSADRDGFLVEAPQADGSRDIGYVSWETGQVQWLVNDGSVNAFAALSVDGRLAWSRRAIDAAHFDLVVREVSGDEWTVPGNGGDWLMPVWSSATDGLFALHLDQGRLRICYGLAVGAQAFRVSLRDFMLVGSADRTVPWQVFGAQTATDGVTQGSTPEILLFHPILSRMLIWRPMQPRDQAATQLNAHSLAALQQSADSAVIGTRDDLLLQSLKQARAHISLVKGLWVPRRTPTSSWPYMLISTGDDGRVGLTAMRLLPIEPSGSSTDPSAR